MECFRVVHTHHSEERGTWGVPSPRPVGEATNIEKVIALVMVLRNNFAEAHNPQILVEKAPIKPTGVFRVPSICERQT
jgi:hypothetical protein